MWYVVAYVNAFRDRSADAPRGMAYRLPPQNVYKNCSILCNYLLAPSLFLRESVIFATPNINLKKESPPLDIDKASPFPKAKIMYPYISVCWHVSHDFIFLVLNKQIWDKSIVWRPLSNFHSKRIMNRRSTHVIGRLVSRIMQNCCFWFDFCNMQSSGSSLGSALWQSLSDHRSSWCERCFCEMWASGVI